MVQQAGPMALTQLSEDERMFRDTVRRFANEQIGPLVRGMDEAQQMDAGILRKLFELGLMGIEVPEEYGGAGGTFFQAVLAVDLRPTEDADLRGEGPAFAIASRHGRIGCRRYDIQSDGRDRK